MNDAGRQRPDRNSSIRMPHGIGLRSSGSKGCQPCRPPSAKVLDPERPVWIGPAASFQFQFQFKFPRRGKHCEGLPLPCLLLAFDGRREVEERSDGAVLRQHRHAEYGRASVHAPPTSKQGAQDASLPSSPPTGATVTTRRSSSVGHAHPDSRPEQRIACVCLGRLACNLRQAHLVTTVGRSIGPKGGDLARPIRSREPA